MRVSDILKQKGDRVVAVSHASSLQAALKMMAEARIGALVVNDAQGGLAGVLSEREVVTALALWGAPALQHTAGEVMTDDAVTIGPADPVLQAMALMTERRARHLPVMENGRVVGLLSIGDVVKSRLSEKVQENAVLQDIARWPHAA